MEGAKDLLLLGLGLPRTRDAEHKQPAQGLRLPLARDTCAREGVALGGEACEVTLLIEQTTRAGVIFVEDAADHSHVAEGDAFEQAGLEQAVFEDHIVRLVGAERTRLEDAASEDDPVQVALDEDPPREARPDDRAVLEVEVLKLGVAHFPGVVFVDF